MTTRLTIITLLCALATLGCRGALPSPQEPWVVTPNEAFRHEPPALAPLPPLELPEVTTAALSSGLRLLVVRTDDPLVAIRYVSRRGGVRETPGAPDASGLTLRALVERPPLGALDADGVAGAGAVSIALSVLPDEVESTITQLAEVIVRPRFDDDRLRLFVQHAVKAKTNQIKNPSARAWYQALRWLLGDADTLGQPANRRVALLKSFDVERAEIAHLRMFTPEDGTLVVVGPVAPDAVRTWFEVHFADWPASGRPRPPVDTTVFDGTSPDIHFVRTPSYRTAVLRQAIPEPAPSSPDYVPHRLFTLVFARMFSSRLNLAVRERAGHSYGALTDEISWPGGGLVLIGAMVDEETAGAVCRSFLTEARRMGREPPSREELITAKGLFRSGLRTRLETSAALAQTLADLAIHGLEPSHLSELDRAAALATVESVHGVATRYLARTTPLVVSGRPDVVIPQLEELNARVLYEPEPP